jgi:hypothetical protein
MDMHKMDALVQAGSQHATQGDILLELVHQTNEQAAHADECHTLYIHHTFSQIRQSSQLFKQSNLLRHFFTLTNKSSQNSDQGCALYTSRKAISQRKIPLSGMLRRVALVRIEVSEGRSASIIRVTRIGESGTALAVTNNRSTLRRKTAAPCSPILVTLMLEALLSSVTSVLTRTTWRNIPEDGILQSQRRANLKSYTVSE